MLPPCSICSHHACMVAGKAVLHALHTQVWYDFTQRILQKLHCNFGPHTTYQAVWGLEPSCRRSTLINLGSVHQADLQHSQIPGDH